MMTLIFVLGVFLCLLAACVLLIKIGSAFVGLMFSLFSGVFSLIGGLLSAVFGLLTGLFSAVAGILVGAVVVPLVLFTVGLGLMLPVLLPLALLAGFFWLLARVMRPSPPAPVPSGAMQSAG
ncbi:MAG: hypothetical protein KDJ14_11680 [Xanthomonadales bacterium]|nr:hypothetical protein [Xanthomonadales bacterium]